MKVSVGIPTYNDRETIGELLVSILKQEKKCFELSEIIVVNEENTDGTSEICEKIAASNDLIRVINLSGPRAGKANALNIMFDEAEGDVLVLFDADCTIKDNKLIGKLIKPFSSMKKLGLVSGWFRHRRTKKPNLIERRYFFYNSALLEFNNENKTFLAASGRILAISKSLYEYVHIPQKTIGDDLFLYLCCLNKGFDFLFNKKAMIETVLHARSLRDMIRYRKRMLGIYSDMMLRFGSLAKKEFEKATSLFLKHILKQCMKHPIEGINFALIELMSVVLTMLSRKKVTYLWRR